MKLITDHVWRPVHWNSRDELTRIPELERACMFNGCGQPRELHERSVSLKRMRGVKSSD